MRSAWLPVPTSLVRMGLGDVTDIIVKGEQVLPAKLLANGYGFQLPTLPDALLDLLTAPNPTGDRRP